MRRFLSSLGFLLGCTTHPGGEGVRGGRGPRRPSLIFWISVASCPCAQSVHVKKLLVTSLTYTMFSCKTEVREALTCTPCPPWAQMPAVILLTVAFSPSVAFCRTGLPSVWMSFIHAGDAVASLRKSADDIIDVLNGISWGSGVCVTEGGAAGASTLNKDLAVSFWRFVVPPTTTPPPPTRPTRRTNKQKKLRQRPEPWGSAQPPGSRASFPDAGRSEPMLWGVRAAVSASLSRVLSERETAGDLGAGEAGGRGCVGSLHPW